MKRKEYKTELDVLTEDAVANNTLIIYVQPPGKECPNCEALKQFLKINKIKHKAVNIRTVEAATEIAFRGKNPKITPVLQRGKTVYYEELWQEKGYKPKKTLDITAIKQIIDSDKENWEEVGKEHECKDGVCSL